MRTKAATKLDRRLAAGKLCRLSDNDLVWLGNSIDNLLITGWIDGRNGTGRHRLSFDPSAEDENDSSDDGPTHGDDLALIGMDMEDAGLDP